MGLNCSFNNSMGSGQIFNLVKRHGMFLECHTLLIHTYIYHAYTHNSWNLQSLDMHTLS